MLRTAMRTTDITVPSLKLKIFSGRLLIRELREEIIERSVFELSSSHIISWFIWRFCRILISLYEFIFNVLRIILLVYLVYNFFTHSN